MRHARPLGIRLPLTLLLTAFVFGCGCEDELITPIDKPFTCPGSPGCSVGIACEKESDCEEHFCCIAAAGGAKSCQYCPRSCTEDAQCCPGQTCNETLGRCFDKFDECTVDADCGRTDRKCLPYTDARDPKSTDDDQTTMRCDYARCTSDGDCEGEASCFSNRCVLQAPCGGSCAAGEACVLANDRCQVEPACAALACDEGFLKVYDDPDDVYDQASCRERSCLCEELEPLRSPDTGRFAASTVHAGTLFVSSYDGRYGDLIVSTIDPATGTPSKIDYVDGVPESGKIIAAPSGPRGGIGDPGVDVGRYTDIVAGADGSLHVSYYDVQNGDLKYARRDLAGAWTIVLVDGADADVGRYSAIALAPDGSPAIAYFQAAGGAGNELSTALKFARASSATPSAPSDFTIAVIEDVDRPAPPCHPGCASGTSCGGEAGKEACHPTATCASACPAGTACFSPAGASAPKCLAVPAQALPGELPLGVGLFPSLVFRDESPAVVYFDSIRRTLLGLEGSGGSFPANPTPATLASAAPSLTSSAPQLAVSSTGTLGFAFRDPGDGAVRFWAYAAGTKLGASPSSEATVDSAKAPSGGLLEVGAELAVAASEGGTWWLAYQHQTDGDLVLYTRDPATRDWSQVRGYTEGAIGFYPDLTVANGRGFLTHTKIRAYIPGLESRVLVVPPFDAP